MESPTDNVQQDLVQAGSESDVRHGDMVTREGRYILINSKLHIATPTSTKTLISPFQ